jgi:hypothetical protein
MKRDGWESIMERETLSYEDIQRRQREEAEQLRQQVIREETRRYHLLLLILGTVVALVAWVGYNLFWNGKP